MPEPVTVQITVTPYAPEESDANAGAYLQRCGEALLEQYGYHYTLQGGADVRQLQINVPDGDMPGGNRAVVIKAPEPVMDVGGDVMTQTAFTAKYGAN